MAKVFVYVKKLEVGKLGNSTVEVGCYTVDGKVMPDKVYLVSHFTRKNGTEDSKVTAICNANEAKELGKLLMKI